MTDRLTFRNGTPDDLDLMVTWAAQEGWNPGARDAECFYAADPAGFWVARRDGEIAACMSLVTYDAAFAFLGFYITRPDLRGQGIGYTLWKHGLADCKAHTIGLDGVVDQQDNYRKSGFTLAHRNIRYGGVPTGVSVSGPDETHKPITSVPFDALAAYDRSLFPAHRTGFLSAWLSTPGHIGLVALKNEQICGYGVIRPSKDGNKIGPLFAEDTQTATSLFDAPVAKVPGETVILDPPEPNKDAVSLCLARGLSPVFETARMYRGDAPKLPIQNIFGITSFELG